MKLSHRCWAEVDLEALRENLAWIRHRVGPTVSIMTVVKADAYGHGLKQTAALLMQSGTDIFGVANLAEARSIRAVGKGWPVLMLGACLPEEVEDAVRDDVRPTLSSLAEARAFSAAAVRQRKTIPVHVKVDTGMGRLGVAVSQAAALLRRVQRLPGLKLEGIFTHFAAAEDDALFTRQQAERFRSVLRSLEKTGLEVPFVHASNSAAVLHEPALLFNLVRPGLLVYGIVPVGKRRITSLLRRPLRPALSLHGRVSLVKEIPRGTSLSYGAAFVAPRPLQVATVTVGYGDGYPRAASGRACVLIKGRRCPVLGRITMDQLLADVSRVQPVKVGEKVTLIGRQGNEEITANELAAWSGTIPWEILTNITYRVPRIYRGGQAA